MKRAVIVGLVALNVVLLVALAMAPDGSKAYGQTDRGAHDYLVTTGHFDHDYDALYVVDLAKRRMCYFLLDKTTKKMIPYGARKFRFDFPAEENK
jgi:uncharacterized membrane protein